MSNSPRSSDDLPARLSADEAVELAAHVAELAKAGLPLADGLRALGRELRCGRLPGVLRAMAGQLEAGDTLEAVLETHRTRFPYHVRGLLLAGIRSGRLPEVLEEFVDLERHRVELRRRVWRILAYPILLLLMMAVLMVSFDAYLMPEFAQIFADFGADLPRVTEFVLQVAGSGTWLVKVGVVSVVALLALSWAMPRASWAPRVLYGIPLVGPLWRFSRLARFSRMMGLLLEQDVPLPEALRLTATGLYDAWLAAGCRQVADEVEAGRPLAESLAAQRQFPPGMIPVIEWGQQASLPADAFRATSEVFEGRVESQGIFMEAILLPVAFLIVVLFISTVVAGLMMPLISLIHDLM